MLSRPLWAASALTSVRVTAQRRSTGSGERDSTSIADGISSPSGDMLVPRSSMQDVGRISSDSTVRISATFGASCRDTPTSAQAKTP